MIQKIKNVQYKQQQKKKIKPNVFRRGDRMCVSEQ